MRLITLVLVGLVVLIQYPLWLGKGGWLRVHELEQQLHQQQHTNDGLKARNDKLEAEVRDLREGAGAVEERARYELGMIREGEIFVQTVDAGHPPQALSPALPAGALAPAATSAAPAATPSAPSGAAIAPATGSPGPAPGGGSGKGPGAVH
jgi:cell division protein FtsB